jgi:hypothetical protein
VTASARHCFWEKTALGAVQVIKNRTFDGLNNGISERRILTAAAPERTLRMVQITCPAFVPGMSIPGFMKTLSLGPVRWPMNTLPPNEKVGRSILRQIGHCASLDANRIP